MKGAGYLLWPGERPGAFMMSANFIAVSERIPHVPVAPDTRPEQGV